MAFWINLALTYLALCLAYVYCETIYTYAAITPILSAATLKTVIVSTLVALAVLLADKETQASGGGSGLKQFLLRFLGPVLRSRLGLAVPLALLGVLFLFAYDYRFVRLEGLTDDLRTVPLQIGVRLSEADSLSPLKPSASDGSYLVTPRQSVRGEWPEVIVSDAYGFRTRKVAVAQRFSWLDYFFGTAVPFGSWFNREVLKPISVGVETLDRQNTYHRYPGVLVPRTEVPYFTPTEGLWKAAAMAATSAPKRGDAIVVTLPGGEQYRGRLMLDGTHLELTHARARGVLKTRNKMVARVLRYVRSRRPTPDGWNVVEFRRVYRELSDGDRNDQLRVMLHNIGVVPGWRDVKTPEQVEALARVVPELLWNYTWINDENLRTIFVEGLPFLESPVAGGHASDSGVPWHPARSRVAVPVLKELVPAFVQLATLKNAEQYRDGILRSIETLLRDRVQHGETEAQELLGMTTRARRASLVEEPEGVHVASAPAVKRPDIDAEPADATAPMVVSK